MVFIPQGAVHAAQQVFHRTVCPVIHHGVGVSVAAFTLPALVYQRLPNGVVERPVIDFGEHGGIGRLAVVLPAPVADADGVGAILRNSR